LENPLLARINQKLKDFENKNIKCDVQGVNINKETIEFKAVRINKK
jgi:hypothetical protein